MAKIYGVKEGRKPGIYTSWAECSEQVNKYPGAKYKSFTDEQEARIYVYGIVNNESKLDANQLGEIKTALERIMTGLSVEDKFDILAGVQDIALLLNIEIDGLSNVVKFLD